MSVLVSQNNFRRSRQTPLLQSLVVLQSLLYLLCLSSDQRVGSWDQEGQILVWANPFLGQKVASFLRHREIYHILLQ